MIRRVLRALFTPAYKQRADAHRRVLVALGAPGSYCGCRSCNLARLDGYDARTGEWA